MGIALLVRSALTPTAITCADILREQPVWSATLGLNIAFAIGAIGTGSIARTIFFIVRRSSGSRPSD